MISRVTKFQGTVAVVVLVSIYWGMWEARAAYQRGESPEARMNRSQDSKKITLRKIMPLLQLLTLCLVELDRDQAPSVLKISRKTRLVQHHDVWKGGGAQ